MNAIRQADQIAADLVAKCYGQNDVLAAVVRIEAGVLRVIAPAERYADLAMMLYRAADAMAEHAAPKPANG